MYHIPGQYDELLQQNKDIILKGIVGAATPQEVESSTFFARYINRIGINHQNYWLFLCILESNNKYIVDALIGNKDPRLLFTIIKPNHVLLQRALQLLTSWHPGQIYEKVLLAVMGIIEYCYHHANDGFKIYPIDISEINNIGKFLEQKKDQKDLINETVLDILDWLSKLGLFEYSLKKSLLAKHAHNIRMAYFDNTKELMDIIPKILLVPIPRENTEVKPTNPFLDFVTKLPNT